MAFANEQFETATDDPAPDLDYIWLWFCGLSGWREQGFGVGPLSHQEILAWCQLYRHRITPAEVDVLDRLDTAMRKHHNKKNNNGKDESISLADGLRAMAEQRDATKRAASLEARMKAEQAFKKKGS